MKSRHSNHRELLLGDPTSGVLVTDTNRRPHQEDRAAVLTSTVQDQPVRIYGVFDGHGGAKMAQELSQLLGPRIVEDLQSIDLGDPRRVKGSIEDSFLALDADLMTPYSMVGTTAVLVIVIGDTIYLANLGDSRALIVYPDREDHGNLRDREEQDTGSGPGSGSAPGPHYISTLDHKPSQPLESRRALEAGFPVIEVSGVSRIGGRAAISRAFGDYALKVTSSGRYLGVDAAISPLPTVTHYPYEPDMIGVLASDGLWDVVSNEEVSQLIVSLRTSHNLVEDFFLNAASSLIQMAKDRGSEDNITVIVTVI